MLCFGFQAERGIFDLFSYLKLFKQLKKVSTNDHANTKQALFILIPVLNEQQIIEDTILRICKIKNKYFKINIAVLTSIKEQTNNKNILTTEDVIMKSLNSGKLSKYKNCIHIFQDPDVNGNMATQLNYAIKKIKSIVEINTYYMVFNADSIISASTFDKLSELINQHNNKEFAFQQPCAFVRDMDYSANQFTNALSLYQSWYCLGHESRLIRSYSKKSVKNWGKNNNIKLGVIVGHGSGMTLDINIKNNGYPTDLLTEDLTFGFNLSANNVPILFLPALELADVPNSFKIFIKQKSVWFWNFLGYLNCYKNNINQGHSRYRLIFLLIQGIGAGAYWFFDTFFIVVPLLLGIILSSYWIVFFSLISFLIFYIFPQYLLLYKMPSVLLSQEYYDKAKDINRISFIKLLPSLCLVILTNSVGAWIATVKYVKYMIIGKLPIKYKTGD